MYNPENLGEIAKLLEQNGITPEHINRVNGARVSRWETVTKEKQEDGTDITRVTELTGSSVSFDPKVGAETFVSQAAPTIIKPSKRKKPSRECETTLFIGDTQFPFQDNRALELARIAIVELAPDTIVFLGDDIDLPNFSTFERRPEWVGTFQTALDGLHRYIAQLRADAPDAKIVMHEGNHNIRSARQIRTFNADLVGIKRANADTELSVLSIEYLLRLDELGVEYVSGYPNAEYWHEDNLKSFHGRQAVSDGSTMSRVINRSTVSCVQGHSNRAEIVYRTFPDGKTDKTIFGMNPGTMCDFDKTPSGSYSTDERGRVTHQTPDWQKTVGLIYHTPDFASPHLLPITADGIQIFDKTYRS